jgi:hypothetical protein
MKFEDWLYETENFNLRVERLFEDLPVDNGGVLIRWLEAAYKVGFEHSENRLMDDGK